MKLYYMEVYKLDTDVSKSFKFFLPEILGKNELEKLHEGFSSYPPLYSKILVVLS